MRVKSLDQKGSPLLFTEPSNGALSVDIYTNDSFCGRRFDAHVCVTAALGDWLGREFGISGAIPAHDKAPGFFAAANTETKQAVFVKGRLGERKKRALTI